MANFCNKCGAPVSGIFCVKCGHDTRLATSPPPQPVRQQVASPVQVSAPPPTVPAASGVPATKFCNKCGAPSIGAPFCNKCGAKLQQAAAQAQPSTPPQQPVPAQTVSAPQASGKGSPLTKILVGVAVVVIAVAAMAAGGVYYVVYRVKQKVHEVATKVPGLGSDQDNSSDGGFMGSISKAVSAAATVPMTADRTVRSRRSLPSSQQQRGWQGRRCADRRHPEQRRWMRLSGARQFRRHDRQTYGCDDGNKRR